MNSASLVDNRLISSIDIINKTNISRATLNNYIKMKIIPNPIIKKPASISTQARRLGYFPETVITTIEQIKKMKKEGCTMAHIIGQLAEVNDGLCAMDSVNQENQQLTPPIENEDINPCNVSRNQSNLGRPAQSGINLPMPTPVTFSIMVARLHNSDRICDELLPDEYFELLNQVWSLAGEIFIKYHGSSSRFSSNEMSYYFFKDGDHEYILNTIRCAIEIRSKLKNVSREWGLRKNWLHEVCLNIGINEGNEYSGIISSMPDLEIMILGETVEQAAGLSEFACHGTIWTTKSLISKLTSVERKNLRYGIRRKHQDSEIIMESLFNRMKDLMDRESAPTGRLQSLARLPITEILDLC